MNLFRRYTLSVSRDEPLAQTCRRIAGVALAAGLSPVRVRFYLGDRLDLKTSAVDRAVARFPWVAPLVIADGRTKALSNLDMRFAEGNPAHDAPVDADRVAELLEAVPKPCPFGLCLLLFDDLPFVKPDDFEVVAPFRKRDRSVHLPEATGAFHANAAPEVLLSARMSSTRITKRVLTATIAMAPLGDNAPSLPTLDPSVASALDGMGKRSSEELLYQCDVAERDRLRETTERLEQISRRWNEDRDEVMRRLPVPHPDLPVDPGPSIGHGYTSPHKEPLIAAFEPRGFRYRPRASGHGVYKLAKLTARNNRLSLDFDVRSWSHKGSCHLRVEGPTWSHSFGVSFVPGHPGNGYPIRSEHAWQQMVANAAVVVDYLEREVVPTIERARDATPAWWRFPA